MPAYREEWSAMIEAGGGVGNYELSDVRVQVLPGGVAVATYFVDGDMFYGQDHLELVERACSQPYKGDWPPA